MKILIINGPNLSLTGMRDKNYYGNETLDEINEQIKKYASAKGAEAIFYTSNHEGGIIDKIHEAINTFDGIIINPGAYTHYSYAIRDAIEAVKLPCIEVHMSNISNREEFRKISVICPVCVGQILGLGKYSYILAVDYLIELLIK